MRTSPTINMAGFLVITALVILVMGVTHERAEAPAPVISNEAPINDYLAKVQEWREEQLEQEHDAARLIKLSNAKKNSVECQFWKQQQETRPSPRVSEKVTQHCELPKTR